MREWNKRPTDVAVMFNPAYCAALLNRVASGYAESTKAGLPYALSFVALPILLHSRSLSLLPKTANSRLHSWLLSSPDIVFGFDERAKSLSPFAREAISFGLRHRVIRIEAPARLVSIDSPSLKAWRKSQENETVCKEAQLVGKLLAQVKDTATVFSLFGVRP